MAKFVTCKELAPTLKTCTRCNGDGFVSERGWLAPLDVAESGHAATLAAGLGALGDEPDVRYAFFIVMGSAFIHEACREAHVYALRDNVTAVFQFCESVVKVSPSDIPDAVARAWWIKTYNMTPEESRASR